MYQGTYYNHQVAKPHPASVQMLEDGLHFTFSDSNDQVRQMHWLLTELEVDLTDRSYIRIVNKADNGGTLEVNNALFVDAFLERYRTIRNTGFQELVLRGGFKAGLVALFIIIGLVALAHFFFLPWCADRIVDRLPRSFDKELGDAARKSMQEDVDTAGSLLLTKFAAQMKWETPEKLTFTVVPSDVENAYALPGGYVVVYTGLLKKLDKKEQLAALLSHEVAHVTRRHSVRKLCRDMSSSLLVTAVLSNASGATATLYSNASAIYNLTYSREYEQQADITGMETLRRNHIDQQGMVELMEELKKLSSKVDVPEFISTHPLTDNRIDYVKKNIKEHTGTVEAHEQMEQVFRQLQALYHKK